MEGERKKSDLTLALLDAELDGSAVHCLTPLILEALETLKSVESENPIAWFGEFFLAKSRDLANSLPSTPCPVSESRTAAIETVKRSFSNSFIKAMPSNPPDTTTASSNPQKPPVASARIETESKTDRSTTTELSTVSTARAFRRSQSSMDAVYRVCVRMRKLLEIKDRKYLGRVYPACFIGSHAVQWMLDSRMARSKKRAVKVGRRMLQLGLIQHVTGDHEFKDAYLFYQFTAQAQEGSNMTRPRREMEDIATRMRHAVDVRERRVRLTTHHSCFRGCDAVTWLVQSGSVTGTSEGVILGNQMMQLGLLRHITDEHEFHNSELLYRFASDELGVLREEQTWENIPAIATRMRKSIQVRERRYLLRVYDSCFLGADAVAWMIRARVADSARSALKLGALMMTAGLVRHVAGKEPFRNADFYYRFAADEEAAAVERSQHKFTWEDPVGVAFLMRKGVLAAAHSPHGWWQRLRRCHHQCFLGYEAVAWMIREQLASTTTQALALGKLLLRTGLILPVGGRHRFRNGEFCYKFNIDHLVPPLDPGVPLHTLDTTQLQQLCQRMCDAVTTRDRVRRWHSHSSVFLGCDAVSWLLFCGAARDSTTALALGNDMIREGLFRHVVAGQPFRNDAGFYRFITDHLWTATPGAVLDVVHDSDTEDVLDVAALAEQCEAMRAGVRVVDRTFRGRKFQLTFLGSDAVAWMVRVGVAESVAEAVVVGNQMMECGLFRHVTDGHRFKNRRLYYRFKPDEARVRVLSLRMRAFSLTRRNTFSMSDSEQSQESQRGSGFSPSPMVRARQAARAQTRDVPFADVLAHPRGIKELSRFAARTFCGENTAFWKDCQRLKRREQKYGVELVPQPPKQSARQGEGEVEGGGSLLLMGLPGSIAEGVAESKGSGTEEEGGGGSARSSRKQSIGSPARSRASSTRRSRGASIRDKARLRMSSLSGGAIAPPAGLQLSPVVALCEYVFDTYIADDSLLMVNLPHGVRAEVMARYHGGERSSSMFDASADVIQRLLQSDVFPRFKESVEYLDMVEAMAVTSQLQQLQEHPDQFIHAKPATAGGSSSNGRGNTSGSGSGVGYTASARSVLATPTATQAFSRIPESATAAAQTSKRPSGSAVVPAAKYAAVD